MSIDKRIVSNVANLARLKLKDADLENMSEELSNVLTWIENLNEVETNGVEPLANITGLPSPADSTKVRTTTIPAKRPTPTKPAIASLTSCDREGLLG